MKAALAATVGAIAIRYLVVVPMQADVEALQSRIAQADSTLRLLAAAEVTASALGDEIEKLERARASTGSASVEPLDPNLVLAELEAAARESGVRVRSARPRAPAGRSPIQSVSFELGIEGRFHDVGRFLARVASAGRVVTTPDVILRASTAREEVGITGSVVVVAFDFAAIAAFSESDVTYDDGGGRDPFDSAIGLRTEQEPPLPARRRHGLGAIALTDVAVRGIVRYGDQMVAILETTGRQSFLVRTFDRLADSVVQEIDPSGVVFTQSDGRGRVVRIQKALRSTRVETP